MRANLGTKHLLVGLTVTFMLTGCGSTATPSPVATPVVSADPSGTVATPTPGATPAPTPGARPAGSIATARSEHTATLLPDGRVLVVGGLTDTQALGSAEIYDPETGRFSPTGSMATARGMHTATTLPDGRVLVAGGLRLGGTEWPAIDAAEIYDPETGTFSPTGSMATGSLSIARGRFNHTATLLTDGRVLMAGGEDGTDGGTATAEIYDPETGRFSPTGSMAIRRWLHTATTLPDGRILVAGGLRLGGTEWPAIDAAEIYDPQTGTFSRTGWMTAARAAHTATMLPEGRVIVAGGRVGSEALATSEIYDPKTDTFGPTGP